MKIAGIDGTSQGLCIAIGNWDNDEITQIGWLYIGSFYQLDELDPFHAITINIPIGLPETKKEKRLCDKLAKRLLSDRGSSLFKTPPRNTLTQTDPDTLRLLGVPIQTQNLLHKIKELDEWITPEKQRIIKETHPELVFIELAKGQRLLSKKKDDGIKQRLALLQELPIFKTLPLMEIVFGEKSHYQAFKVSDMVDSLACLVITTRIITNTAKSLPEDPEKDATGLYHSIWY